MAGTNPKFNATSVRAALHLGMTMGQPNTPSDRATFQWKPQPVYAPKPAGPSGVPYDLNELPTSKTAIKDIQLLCAVEYGNAAQEGTPAGFEEALKATVTLMDTEYTQLLARGKGRLPDFILLGGALFNIDYTVGPYAVFDMEARQF